MLQYRRYSFGKNERLCLRNDIENVIRNGKKKLSYPFLVNYVIKDAQDNAATTKIAISVAKRNFKKAVDRNLLKRRIREAYRQHKHNLAEIACKKNKVVNAIIVYVSKEKLPYAEIEQGIIKSLENLAKSIEKISDISIDSAD
ncbi:MAG: ribonuclease P protein component [Prevotellaceae bacterium]|jgi:ribonuclease P protein component|nr:ribonuclease P protein component [Prevotellaceae bacterium]